MAEADSLQELLARARVHAEVFALRPDYRAMLLAVDGSCGPGLVPGPTDEASEALLVRAEAEARDALGGQQVEQLPHVAAWREAYRVFGAKPERTRNSQEALLRRAASGLPRVNRLTDLCYEVGGCALKDNRAAVVAGAGTDFDDPASAP